MAEMERTRLARRFVIKTLLFFVACAAFGGWFLYDAMVAYPARGERYASWAQWEYLKACREQVQMGRASVEDPAGELARLREREESLRRDASGTGPGAGAAAVELARLEWLEALETIGALEAERTRMEDPYAVLDRLEGEWSRRTPPAKLKGYDIPSQWILAVVCLGVAAWVLGLFVVVASRRYRWEAATKTLTLPNGARLTPADVEEFDKRKWHKFLVDLRVREGHERLGGKTVRLDVYRYEPLEAWVLEMERAAFPEEPAGGEGAGSAAGEAEAAARSG